jgi:hypothetical protein
VAFESTFRYINDVLSINNNQFHTYIYVDSIYPNYWKRVLHICFVFKNTTNILLKLDTKGILKTQFYHKRDDFSFSNVNCPYLCSNISISPAYGVYVSQLIRCAIACSTYDQCILIRGSLLTKKLMSQGFLQFRSQTAFRKLYGRYNDLVCQYNIPLDQILSDVFHTNR